MHKFGSHFDYSRHHLNDLVFDSISNIGIVFANSRFVCVRVQKVDIVLVLVDLL